MKKTAWLLIAMAATIGVSMTAFADGELVSDEAMTFVDDENCSFTLDTVEIDEIFGYTWNITAVNKTDKTLMFSLNEVSVNGLMMDPLWATEVEPGATTRSDIDWFSDEFEKYIANDVKDVEFELKVSDSEDWEADDLVKEVFSYEPNGEAVPYEREPAETDTVLIDNEYLSIIELETNTDDLWGFGGDFYFVNKTDKRLTVAVDSAVVNGFTADPYWATTIAPGKCLYDDIRWSDSTLEEAGVEGDITEIRMTFHAYDDDDWLGDYFLDDTEVQLVLSE